MLAANVVASIDRLTDNNRFKAFVLDDSVIGRKRSKRVELLSYVFDHVAGKSVKGFNLLTLGWTDGFSFIYEEVRDLELSDALEKLVSILAVGIAQGRIQVDEVIRAELLDWYISQPIFIQSLCQSQLFKGSLW
jgi:hypothetical protein